jgi:chromosome segregation ATPase
VKEALNQMEVNLYYSHISVQLPDASDFIYDMRSKVTALIELTESITSEKQWTRVNKLGEEALTVRADLNSSKVYAKYLLVKNLDSINTKMAENVYTDMTAEVRALKMYEKEKEEYIAMYQRQLETVVKESTKDLTDKLEKSKLYSEVLEPYFLIANAEISSLKDSVKELKGKLQQKRDQFNDLKTKNRDLYVEVQRVKDSQLAEEAKLNKEIADKSAQINEYLQSFTLKDQEIQHSKDSLQVKIEEFLSLKDEFSSLKQLSDDLTKTLSQKDAECKNVNDQLVALKIEEAKNTQKITDLEAKVCCILS